MANIPDLRKAKKSLDNRYQVFQGREVKTGTVNRIRVMKTRDKKPLALKSLYA